jgi:hypothetical protein
MFISEAMADGKDSLSALEKKEYEMAGSIISVRSKSRPDCQ